MSGADDVTPDDVAQRDLGSDASSDEQQRSSDEGPVINDKRRIDPETGSVRASSQAAAKDVNGDASPDLEGDLLDAELTQLEAGLVADLQAVQQDLVERTSDLQRLHAEYSNYRKRVDRDRDAVRDQAVAHALEQLLPILDDVGRAREHGELDGAFKAVGESLEAVVRRIGLEEFGLEGDPFDPTIHEAFTHEHSDDVTESTCIRVFRPGYRFAGRVVRPAQVAVADPQE